MLAFVQLRDRRRAGSVQEDSRKGLPEHARARHGPDRAQIILNLDERWRENDGLVNTVSAMAPMGAPSKAFDPEAVTPGIWQILPTYPGDHMSLQGGMLKRNNIRPFYLELLDMIDTLPEG